MMMMMTSQKVQLLSPIFETEWLRGSNCVSAPNFMAIGPTIAEIWLCQISSTSVKPRLRYGDFFIFQDGGRRHLEFFKFQIFNGWTSQEGRTASPGQIWSKSVKMRPRYGDFSISQDGGRRHHGFFIFQIFNGRTAEEGWTASTCQNWSKSVKMRPRYGDFSTFPRWRSSAILDLLCVCVQTTHEWHFVVFIGVQNLVESMQ